MAFQELGGSDRPGSDGRSLPWALAQLTVADLIKRLLESLPREDLGWALLLSHEFIRFVETWEKHAPQTPLALYRGILRASREGGAVWLERVGEAATDVPQALDGLSLVTSWWRVIEDAVPESRRASLAPFMDLLWEILCESKRLMSDPGRHRWAESTGDQESGP